LTTLVSWQQKDKTILDFNEARDDGDGSDISWTTYKSDNQASTLSLTFLHA